MERQDGLEREMVELLRDIRSLLSVIVLDIRPRLSRVLIAFSSTATSTLNAAGDITMGAPVAGPVILSTAGQKATASVLGFDQFGNPWTGTIPPVTFTSSDTAAAVITSVPNTDGITDAVTAVGNGVANLTASLSTAEGLSLTDTESVTVAIGGGGGGTPVLSSIKVGFA